MRTGLLIALCIIIGSTFSTIIASAWSAPTASPPGSNVASPVNVGTVMQLKNGTLGVNGLGVFGNTILNGTNGDGTGNDVNSYLNFGATVGTNGYGIRDNNGTLEFKNTSDSWGSLNVTLTNLLQVNGITPNGLGQITSIKFGDGTTQTTAASTNPWSINGTSIYYNGGNVGIGTASPYAGLTVEKTTVTGGGGWSAYFREPGAQGVLIGSRGNSTVTAIGSIMGVTADLSSYASLSLNPFGGNVGIGTQNPTSPLTVNGIIQTTSGGVEFPNNTIQKTAGPPNGCHIVTNIGSGPNFFSDARCASNEYVLTGGGEAEMPGYSLCSGTSKGFIHFSAPDSDLKGWSVDAYDGSLTHDACSEAYAVCCPIQ